MGSFLCRKKLQDIKRKKKKDIKDIKDIKVEEKRCGKFLVPKKVARHAHNVGWSKATEQCLRHLHGGGGGSSIVKVPGDVLCKLMGSRGPPFSRH